MAIGTIVSGLRMALVVLAAGASLCSACTTEVAPRPGDTTGAPSTADGGRRGEVASRMRATIGSKVFNATLSDNETAKAFKAILPVTANMSELNANEKYFRLKADLPHKEANPGTIHAGDLMLYGSNSLVLFYKTFSTSYSYTRIGKVDDVTGLAAALGSQDVTVTFEL